MKKFFVIVAVLLTVSLVGCENSNSNKLKYQARAEQFAAQLDSVCKLDDAAAALAIDDSIRRVESEVQATGDTAAINAYRTALKDARQRYGEYLTKAKVESGEDRDEALQDVIDDALNNDVSITTVTRSIQAVGSKQTGRPGSKK